MGKRTTGAGAGRKGRDSSRPTVSVVIVNWNACIELSRCLKTLLSNHPGLDLRIVVVDNASTDGSVDMLLSGFPAVRLIENPENRGFAAANNQAFETLDDDSRFVLVLNPDIEFTGNTLEALLDFFARRPDVHVVSPRILGPDGALQRGCRRRDPGPVAMLGRLVGLDRLFPASRRFAGYTYGDMPEDMAHEVQAASGSFLFFRGEVLEAAGGFDERFFMYAEDLDWCLKAREKGFSIYYYPGATVIHHRAASSSRRPLRSLWHLHYTAFQYIEKNRRQDYSLILRAAIYPALVLHFILSALPACFRGLFSSFFARQNKR